MDSSLPESLFLMKIKMNIEAGAPLWVSTVGNTFRSTKLSPVSSDAILEV